MVGGSLSLFMKLSIIISLLFFLVIIHFNCKKCNSFEEISKGIYLNYSKKYTQIEKDFQPVQLQLDRFIQFAKASPETIQVDKYFSNSPVEKLLTSFNELGIRKVSVIDSYGNYSSKAFLFFPSKSTSSEILDNYECTNRVTFSLIYLSKMLQKVQ